MQIVRRMRFFLPGFVALWAAGFLNAGFAVSIDLAQEESHYVCAPGETAVAAFRITNPGETEATGRIRFHVRDRRNFVLESREQEVAVPGGESVVVRFSADIAEPGYYDAECQGQLGDQVLPPVHVSFVRLCPRPDRTGEGRFGLYRHGSHGLVADREPLGYYRYFTRTGVQWATVDLWWNDVQPDGPDTWEWALFDKQFDDARAAGLTLIPHLFGVPEWAAAFPTKDGKPVNAYAARMYPPKDEASWAAWERYVEAFVGRYKDHLTYLRIWNEFDTAFWRGSYADFARLLRIAYEAAHRAKPDIQIVIDVALAKVSVLEALMQEGGGGFFDVVSIHNYQLEKAVPPEQTAFLEEYRAFVAWRDERCPDAEVWESEICWLAEPWETPNWYGHGEEAQAQYAVRGTLLARSAGMEKVIWFPYHSWPMRRNDEPYEHGGALIRYNMTPRPAFASFHTLVALLDEAEFNRYLETPSDSAYLLEFRLPDGRYVTVGWTIDPEEEYVTFEIDSEEVACVSMEGAQHRIFPRNGRFGLPLDRRPQYLLTDTPLQRVEGAAQTTGYAVRWEVSPPAESELSLRVSLDFEPLDNTGACLEVSLEYPGLECAPFRKRVDLFQGRGARVEGSIAVPIRTGSGSIPAHLSIGEIGRNPLRIPISIPTACAEAPLWRAASSQATEPCIVALTAPQQVKGALVTFPEGRAFDVRFAVREGGLLRPLSAPGVVSGAVWVPIDAEIEALEISFRNMMPAPSFEDGAVIHPQGARAPAPFWGNGSARPYLGITDARAHTGDHSVEIDARNAGRGRVADELSNVQTVIPVKPDTYYTFSGYFSMPETQDAWGALFAVGKDVDGVLLPHVFSVLPAVGDEWRRVYLTVRTEPGQDTLRISCSLHGNGLMYCDDIQGIEGTIPTDIPTVTGVDFVGPDGQRIEHNAE